MHTRSNPFPCAAVRRWEEAGSLLSSALKSYLDSCSYLETAYLQDERSSKDLISRIDSSLDSLHITLSQQLTQSRSTLARTRNKRASPIYTFPEEILVEIFLDVIFVPADEERATCLQMESTFQTIFQGLHTLLSVCATWRNVAVNCKAAWHVIPFIDGDHELGPKRLATELSLQRANNGLHLAAIQANGRDTHVDSMILNEHAHRFSTVNICANYQSDITTIISVFLESRKPTTLDELSICQIPQKWQDKRYWIEAVPYIPEPHDYIYNENSPSLRQFCTMLESLSIFRVSGVFIRWDKINFSTRLTELYLHRITLGYDSDLVDFLRAASSASELRDLKIISVLAFPGDGPPDPKLSFSKLQTLYLEDLDYRVLELIFGSISPGSHRLILYLTGRSITIHEDEETQEPVSFDELCKLLEQVTVDTLMLDENRSWTSPLNHEQLQTLLSSVPRLKTLKLTSWTFMKGDWDFLTDYPLTLPSLEELHLSRADFFDADGIKRVVESHSIRKIVLGACVRETGREEDSSSRWDLEYALLQDSRTDIVEWLKAVVPEVYLNTDEYNPPEFNERWWKLW
ncbi:unnamed protein product [Rhizoctonia solani]|uniref:F-box domain-containing protein n=1 Tax=Rhizoctonia solani TaxID=456999 RepID=A0A8H3DEV1_9AGAM|nr:unnamed protein product [Rhizoctonia solani]